MKRIGFIGAYDKIDIIINLAKILVECDKKVLVIDSTINQKARYVIPAMKPVASYITDYEDIDVAVGFNNYEQIKKYLRTEKELPYDYVLIDIDNPYNMNGFELEKMDKNYFVTGFDAFSLKRGMQILSLIQDKMKFSKILFSEDTTKEEDDYLNYISDGYKITWDENRIYFPIENGDRTILAENQRARKIKFRRLSQQHKDSLLMIADEIAEGIKESQIKKAIRFLEKGV